MADPAPPTTPEDTRSVFKKFPPQFWLVVMFEFFERGSYYGMMSFLSVYFTDKLMFTKEDVGIIKSTIQPLLYFLPIITGALADRFGYRRTLLIAFGLLGGGYFLTSQMTTYAAIFLSLVLMGVGAGTFKPVISGSIARLTDERTSTLGFGIFYWSINLGAFLFPLILVPWLKKVDPSWSWVIIASAIGTGMLIIPTMFLYKEPPISAEAKKKAAEKDLVKTVATAFEIVYSPLVLVAKAMGRSQVARVVWVVVTAALVIGTGTLYAMGGPFPPLFIATVAASALAIVFVAPRFGAASGRSRGLIFVGTVAFVGLFVWLMPGLSLFARIVSTVIFLTVVAIYLFDLSDEARFWGNSKFLLLIFIYSGFWVLYFQMFDSVLWYVQDYVDATALNDGVNTFLGWLGLETDWRFDVEHVTVLNAGTIILLQLVISNIVKKRKALPTMVVGILLGTVGMAILAIDTSIWVFIAGTVIFSVGEMTAHPKFIAYIGETAPRDKVAMYMGYIFLYGVIGSSIGGVLGANLYVHFVDELQAPRTLWIIFSLIGVATILGLLAYNKFVLGGRRLVDGGEE